MWKWRWHSGCEGTTSTGICLNLPKPLGKPYCSSRTLLPLCVRLHLNVHLSSDAELFKISGAEPHVLQRVNYVARPMKLTLWFLPHAFTSPTTSWISHLISYDVFSYWLVTAHLFHGQRRDVRDSCCCKAGVEHQIEIIYDHSLLFGFGFFNPYL